MHRKNNTTHNRHTVSLIHLLAAAMLCLLCSTSLWGQTIIMNASGQQTIYLQPGTTYTLYDPGGQGDYPANCTGQLNLVSSCGQPIKIQGSYNCQGSPNFFISDWGDGTMGSYHVFNLLTEIGDTGMLNYVSTSDSISISFYSLENLGSWGFEFTVKSCCPTIHNIRASQIQGPGTLTLTWNDISSATEWYIQSGSQQGNPTRFDTVYQPHTTLRGLEGNIYYWYQIASNNTSCQAEAVYTPPAAIWLQCLPGNRSCIDITERSTCNTTYNYGPLENPYLYTTLLDYGYANTASRHTLHTTPELDPRTNNGLRTIPFDFSTSARLGGVEANRYTEGIRYRHHVDTLNNDLIIMRYAAVMENPNHPSELQPKFTFKILDSTGTPMGNDCYQALFVSGDNLGWSHGVGNWIWKNWTAMGFNLGSLHGQDIYIDLNTFDCDTVDEGHTAYAYYVLECGRKKIVSTLCGQVEGNTFTAPDGFSYRWYNANAPNVTLGTNRSLHVTDSGVFHCVCSYTTPNSANCSFTLTAISGNRWPSAAANWEIVGYDGCNTLVRLLDNSVISVDEAHTNLTSFPCEGALWLIDTTFETNEANPIVSFSSGQHTVTLIASLSNGICVDSVTLSINISEYNISDTVEVTLCDDAMPYEMFDSLYYTAGTYEIVDGCHQRLLVLNVNPTYITHFNDTVAENHLPYQIAGHSLEESTHNMLISMNSVAGCDSLVVLNLYVRPNDTTRLDTTICQNQLPLTWDTTTFTQAGSASVTLTNTNGGDSIVIRTLHISPTYLIYDTLVMCQGDSLAGEYTVTGDYQIDALTVDGCDSIVFLNLTVHPVYLNEYWDTICSNQNYEWHTITTQSSGDYTYQQLSQQQCDSNEVLHLTVKNASIHTDVVRICNGGTYTWIDGITYTESTNLPQIVYNFGECDSILQLDLIISNNFHATMEIQPPLVSYDNNHVELRDISGGRSRQWHYMGLMDTANVVYFTYPLEEDSVEVMLIAVSHDNCTDTAYGLVRPDRAVLWAPNVFTPNESQNREFVIKSNELVTATVWVYDRGGNLMATFDGINGSWDGTNHGKPCKQAAYVWVMRYTTLSQPRQEKTTKGTVLLLR